MKKLMLPIILLSSVFSVSAMADGYYGGGQTGGFNGPNSQSTLTTAKQVQEVNMMSFRDEPYAVLTGYIVERIGDEKYLFRDSTGTIRVDIDNDEWYGIQASPKTKVTLYGEVDAEFGQNELEVERMQVAS